MMKPLAIAHICLFVILLIILLTFGILWAVKDTQNIDIYQVNAKTAIPVSADEEIVPLTNELILRKNGTYQLTYRVTFETDGLLLGSDSTFCVKLTINDNDVSTSSCYLKKSSPGYLRENCMGTLIMTLKKQDIVTLRVSRVTGTTQARVRHDETSVIIQKI